MPQLDLIDDTYVVAPPATVAAAIHDPLRWQRWWPDLDLSIFQDRGEQGIRWNVGGALRGSMEVWLEPAMDGVILHYYLRADSAGAATLSARLAARRAGPETRRRALAAKRAFWQLKDELEGPRPAGEPAATC